MAELFIELWRWVFQRAPNALRATGVPTAKLCHNQVRLAPLTHCYNIIILIITRTIYTYSARTPIQRGPLFSEDPYLDPIDLGAYKKHFTGILQAGRLLLNGSGFSAFQKKILAYNK